MKAMARRLLLAFALATVLIDVVGAVAAGIGQPHFGPTTTQQAVDQINRSVTRPVPSVPPPVVARPSSIWVPEHFTVGDVKVPGHWQQRLPDGSLSVPPLVVDDPRTGPRLIPGHVAPGPSAEQNP